MNPLYLSNGLQQPVTHAFAFGRRNEKIDWRRIASVDVERVARDLDFKILQDNIEQITLCNIDAEVDTRMMDPNFVKLYKMAQLTIEYLLLCQDQITSQLVDYEQTKAKSVQDRDEFNRELQKLKNELNTTKKESKKRKKTIEEQQKMLMTQHPPHHTCPVCSHSFLTLDYLQSHIHRRHPEFDTPGKREHDIDIEKENQRIKDELHKKETELQVVKTQKSADEEKIREREESIRQLKEEISGQQQKITILEEKCFTLRSTTQQQATPPRQQEAGLQELIQDNKKLHKDNEDLAQKLQQTEKKLKKEEKLKRNFENQVHTLQEEIKTLNEALRSAANASHGTKGLTEEITKWQNKYNEERNRRKNLQVQLDAANKQLAQLQNQPPPIIDRRSPAPPPRSSVSPPPISVPSRPTPKITIGEELFLPQYCPKLVRQFNQNPRFMNKYRTDAKRQFNDELHQHENLNIDEKDTRLSDSDYVVKMSIVNQTRQNIQDDLPNFENIRRELSQKLDRIVNERLKNAPSASLSNRSSGGKSVQFEDESPRHHETSTTRQPTTTPSKPRPVYTGIPQSVRPEYENQHESDSDDYSESTKSAPTADIQPSPRKNPPSAGVSALVMPGIKPVPTSSNSTVSALVRPKSKLVQNESESEDDSSSIPNVMPKPRVPDQKPNNMTPQGQKSVLSALPQAFQPSQKTIATRDDDDDEDDSSLTSIHDTNPPRNPTIGTLVQGPLRPLVNTNTNQNLSSGEMSQYTYDSLLRSQAGKGADLRRPPTADSAKTSMFDSDDEIDRED